MANTLNTFENSDVRATTIVTEKPVFTLKIRGGRETYLKRDGTIGTAGKGTLIQMDKATTLGVTQDQYLFVPERENDTQSMGHSEQTHPLG